MHAKQKEGKQCCYCTGNTTNVVICMQYLPKLREIFINSNHFVSTPLYASAFSYSAAASAAAVIASSRFRHQIVISPSPRPFSEFCLLSLGI